MSIRDRIAGVYDQWSSFQKASWLSHFIVAGFITYVAGWGVGFDVAARVAGPRSSSSTTRSQRRSTRR